MKNIIIIGAGPAGISAGIYAARSGMHVTIFDGNVAGGQTMNVSKIENYPAIESISGAEFAIKLYNHALNNGVNFIQENVDHVDFLGERKKVFAGNNVYESKYIIIANGVRRRELGCKGEKEFTGKGVSYCAVCDGNFFKGQDVCVVGGGNSAVENGLYLSQVCHKVYIFIRKDRFKEENRLVELLKEKDNVQIIYESEVIEIKGKEKVKSVLIKKDNNISEVEVSGVFIAIGYVSNNDMFKKFLNLSKEGYIITDENCETNVEGVYAAGDTRSKNVRQIITAEADGAIAVSTIVMK